jgi:hypothetical protein
MSTWSFGRRFGSGGSSVAGGSSGGLPSPFLPFFSLLPFSWSWREVVATVVVAERME